MYNKIGRGKFNMWIKFNENTVIDFLDFVAHNYKKNDPVDFEYWFKRFWGEDYNPNNDSNHKFYEWTQIALKVWRGGINNGK